MTERHEAEGKLDWLGEAVERTATSVEQLHRSIAGAPLELMQKSGFFEQTAQEISDVQERSIGFTYDLVRDVNRQVTRLLSDLLAPRSLNPDLGAQ